MATTTRQAGAIIEDESLAEDELLNELESSDIPASIREARMAQFKEMARDFNEMKDKNHGDYSEILEEKKFLDTTVSEERCIVHFFHPDFRRCEIVDRHLKTLSTQHFESRFLKISVEKAKFFVAKLKILVLPAILCFKKGVVVDRIIGFEELGNTDDFPTEVLERRFQSSGVIFGKKDSSKTSSVFGFQKKKTSEDDSDDD